MNFSASAPAASSAADDATLLARYLTGDDHAFAPLLARHQSRVFTRLVLIVHDRALAEDLTQDTFIKVIKMLRDGRYQDEGKFGAWVCRIAHNLAIDTTRRLKRTATVSLDAPIGAAPTDRPNYALPTRAAFTTDTTAPSPETLTIQTEGRDHLRRLIEELPVAQRQVLLMRHYGDMTFQEIADATGVSVNTALGRMRYALVNLRRRMLPTASVSATGASLLMLTLLATGGATGTTISRTSRNIRSELFTYFSPEPDSDDPNFYPRDAHPVRIQRPA